MTDATERFWHPKWHAPWRRLAIFKDGSSATTLQPRLANALATRPVPAPMSRMRVRSRAFPGSHFDAVVLARVLYLISDWQAVLREAYEALKPGGHILHEWGNGYADEAWVQIRNKLRALFQSAGVENPFHPGAGAAADVDAYLMNLGLVRSAELRWVPGRV